ncbi:MAG: Hsp70 family protein [Myxococcota bacterium]|nr:Hsp70 family protein [Myxococcota bacterium]
MGTTSASAARLVEGQVQFLTPSPHGIPAVLALSESGDVIVGEAARRRLQAMPQAGIRNSKRLIGQHSSTVANQVRQLFTYELAEGESDTLLLRIQEQVLTLEQVTTAILKEIKREAEGRIGEPVRKAVITVPAYFNERQRQAVQAAASLAGLEVLSLLNEPTAAAIAYGHNKTVNERIAVFDLGGGTLDIAVVDVHDRTFDVVAAGGDTFLGGVDFDEAISRWALVDFLETHPQEDLSPFALPRLRVASEDAKIALSDRDSAPLFVPALSTSNAGGRDLSIDLTRESLEELSQPLLNQCVSRLSKVLQMADDRPISKILIIGGQSQMPLLRSVVLEATEAQLEESAHPLTSVVSGAAIYAASLGGTTTVDLTERLNLGISIGLPDGTVHRLFECGTLLPAQCSRQFTTHQDNQSAILLELFQGNAELIRQCESLGSLCFGGLRDAPAGGVQLSVRFQLDEAGRLAIRAIDPTTGEQVEAHLETRQLETPEDAAEDSPPAIPPPLRLPLPGLDDVHQTLLAERETETIAPEILETHQDTQTQESAPPPPTLSMPPLPPLERLEEPETPHIVPSTAAPSNTVRLGENKPYPKHLALRDWIRDFFGGLLGN